MYLLLTFVANLVHRMLITMHPVKKQVEFTDQSTSNHTLLRPAAAGSLTRLICAIAESTGHIHSANKCWDKLFFQRRASQQ